jgi:hypothetical protein
VPPQAKYAFFYNYLKITRFLKVIGLLFWINNKKFSLKTLSQSCLACLTVADPESFHWVGIQYRNSAPQYATVLATVLRYLGRQESEVVLGLPKTRLGPPLMPHISITLYKTTAK